MEGSDEDATQHDPQVGRRTELYTHDGSEDGARACNIQELNQENAPTRHWGVVNTIRLGIGWRLALGLYAENTLHQRSVEDVTQYQTGQRQTKCVHNNKTILLF